MPDLTPRQRVWLASLQNAMNCLGLALIWAGVQDFDQARDHIRRAVTCLEPTKDM